MLYYHILTLLTFILLMPIEVREKTENIQKKVRANEKTVIIYKAIRLITITPIPLFYSRKN